MIIHESRDFFFYARRMAQHIGAGEVGIAGVGEGAKTIVVERKRIDTLGVDVSSQNSV